MLDHGLTQLGAVDGSAVHQPEQVTEGVGTTLALTAAVDNKFVGRTQGSCERLEWRWQFAKIGSQKRISGGRRQRKKQLGKLSVDREIVVDISEAESEVPGRRIVEPEVQAADRGLSRGRLLKMRLVVEF
jgi:hypothetical protein